MSTKAVIFDLDGTLMHTLPDIHTAILRMQTALGYPKSEYEDTVGGINHGARELVKHALPDDVTEEELLTALDAYSDAYADCYADTTAAFDGIDELTDKLYRGGVRLAVLSNKPDPFTKRLAAIGFGDRFSPVIGQGIYAPKPSTEAPLAIASGWGIEPDKIIFVGDSDVDMMTAKAAGMYAVGVSWGYRAPDLLRAAGADAIVDTADELYDLITNGR